ncbi:EamA family transporter [Marinobacterium weihaiense]|uniref:EamA family transporter n=1 Tax=Marinobacterium weihaiense TaxID=2851016 RepID=A0ABS6MF40_9GAMM|nr:EamA family transporter [Marinobacterium weihaiense]MBV0934740.1 EamA family transporter [Marinobacterium weihaiense]
MSDRTASTESASLPLLLVLISLLSQYIGAAAAKGLFPSVGAEGVTALRIGLSALLLAAWWRPWRRWPDRRQLPTLLGYGLGLGAMNLAIYHAIARIPIGIAIAIEVTGPLMVALIGSRRPRDFAWVALAIIGLALLAPIDAAEAGLDPLGVLYAVGAALCWALYILFGKRASAMPGGDSVAWGLLIASTFTIPVGLAHTGAALFTPTVLLIGLAVAILSSVVPYSLEMRALRTLPSHVFGLALSASPAVAALIGFVILDEQLSRTQWIAILCIVCASAGNVVAKGRTYRSA